MSIASPSFSEESDSDDSYDYEPLTHAATSEAAEGLRHEAESEVFRVHHLCRERERERERKETRERENARGCVRLRQ